MKLVDEESLLPSYILPDFYRKVYGLVAAQVAVTSGVVLICMYPLNQAMRSPQGQTISLIGGLAALFTVCQITSFKQRFPWNAVLLFSISIGEGFVLGHVCVIINDGILILTSFLACASTFTCLSAITLCTSNNIQHSPFRQLSATVALSSLMASGFLMVSNCFFPMSSPMSYLISTLGIVGFSSLVVYDTSLLSMQYNVDESIEAALQLYLDILNLFMCFLQCLNGSSE